jgi:hypothetical protein
MKRIVAVVLVAVLLVLLHQPKVSAPVQREWTVADSKSYARVQMIAWQKHQYECLDELWTRESNWRANAYNRQKVMGRNAYGIPQILGLKRGTHPTEQIDKGLKYIIHRYGTPCMAWKFHQRLGWY